MHDALTAAREQARQWREAQEPPVADGLVIVLDGLFVGWAAELPPLGQWAPGCLAVAGDDRLFLIDRRIWREPLAWFDLNPPADPPPSPPSPPSPPDASPPETSAAP
jgi:hypothetical protein